MSKTTTPSRIGRNPFQNPSVRPVKKSAIRVKKKLGNPLIASKAERPEPRSLWSGLSAGVVLTAVKAIGLISDRLPAKSSRTLR